MEIYITLGVLQENNNMLVYVIVHVCVYMDLLVIITNDTFKNIDILDGTLNSLENPVMKFIRVNASGLTIQLFFLVMWDRIKHHNFKLK